LAPRQEQRRIVAEIEKQFTRLDDAVAGLKRVQANLKRYRASVLKAACEGQLVPTEAELARKEGRAYEPASELLERILAERHAKWEAEQLRKMTAAGKTPQDDEWKKKYEEPVMADTSVRPDLPEGWTWATWGQVGFSQNGRPFPSKQYSREGVKLLRPGNLHERGRVEWTPENARFLPQHFEEDNPDLVVGSNELIINLTAQSLRDEFLGRVCLTSEGDHCLLNQRLARLTPILMSRRFMLWLFKSTIFRKFVDGLNTGSLIQHMFTSQIARFHIPVPPLAEQERIADAIEEQLSSLEHLGIACQKGVVQATVLRREVLRAAFEGKLVSHDPYEEPTSVLLERIRAGRLAVDNGRGNLKSDKRHHDVTRR
jgi:type I restriction enzyme S subunit